MAIAIPYYTYKSIKHKNAITIIKLEEYTRVLPFSDSDMNLPTVPVKLSVFSRLSSAQIAWNLKTGHP